MPTIVISAVNLVEGGTLKVLQDCLAVVRERLPGWRVIALVNNAAIIDTDGVELITMPWPKKSWLGRVWAEYFTFYRLSKKIKPDIWWSLHDMSPRVVCGSQFVYCHNPNPFFKFSLAELSLEPKQIFFSSLYSIFYRVNIKSNRAVVVQQEWLRREFKEKYGVQDVVVAHPVAIGASRTFTPGPPVSTFVYPSFPRVFKNFELIGEAARILHDEPEWNGKILLTIEKNQNRLARHIFKKYGHLRGVRFIGHQTRADMTQLYADMDCLLFPSRLETWGLPISETKSLGKPMIVADLEYAHETVGSYAGALFVDPFGARNLARVMLDAHRNGWQSKVTKGAPTPEPFAQSWEELIDMLIERHERACPSIVESAF